MERNTCGLTIFQFKVTKEEITVYHLRQNQTRFRVWTFAYCGNQYEVRSLEIHHSTVRQSGTSSYDVI